MWAHLNINHLTEEGNSGNYNLYKGSEIRREL